jgi:hypothetical protein
MKQVAIDIQPGYKLISNEQVQTKLDGGQLDFSQVWTITGISSDNPTPDNEIYTYEFSPNGPNAPVETGTITYSEIITNYKVLTPVEWVGLKSGKMPDNWLETLEAYPTSSDEVPPVQTAGFLGLPKLFWIVAVGGVIFYIAKRNKMI